MDEKEQKIIEAAIDAFSRYGFRRTTVGEIASAAGVSRQTLYSSYSNKEDILAEVVRHLAETTLATIEDNWSENMAIGDKLDVYFEHAVLTYYDKIRQMPDANELIAGVKNLDSAEIKRAEKAKCRALAAQFLPFTKQLEKAGTNAAEIGDMIQTSSQSFKYAAESRKHLQQLLHSLKTSVLALVGE